MAMIRSRIIYKKIGLICNNVLGRYRKQQVIIFLTILKTRLLIVEVRNFNLVNKKQDYIEKKIAKKP